MTLDDQATEREEMDREIALKVRRPELKHVGFCYNCGEETHGAFCCPECRDDWTKRDRFNK